MTCKFTTKHYILHLSQPKINPNLFYNTAWTFISKHSKLIFYKPKMKTEFKIKLYKKKFDFSKYERKIDFLFIFHSINMLTCNTVSHPSLAPHPSIHHPSSIHISSIIHPSIIHLSSIHHHPSSSIYHPSIIHPPSIQHPSLSLIHHHPSSSIFHPTSIHHPSFIHIPSNSHPYHSSLIHPLPSSIPRSSSNNHVHCIHPPLPLLPSIFHTIHPIFKRHSSIINQSHGDNQPTSHHPFTNPNSHIHRSETLILTLSTSISHVHTIPHYRPSIQTTKWGGVNKTLDGRKNEPTAPKDVRIEASEEGADTARAGCAGTVHTAK